MKAATVFAFLAIAIHNTHAANVNYFEDDLLSSLQTRSTGDKIKVFLEVFKKMMKTGDETMGIPKMDPLFVKHQDINIEDELINLEGEVNNVHAEGLSNFNIQHADFKIAKKNFSIELQWPSLKGKTLCNIITAKLMDYIPIFGNGDADFEMTNFTFGTNAIVKLDLKNKIIKIVSFNNTNISLENLKLNFRGLYNNDELSKFMSDIISDNAPSFVVNFQKQLTTRVDEVMLSLANEILKHINFDDIWGIIGLRLGEN